MTNGRMDARWFEQKNNKTQKREKESGQVVSLGRTSACIAPPRQAKSLSPTDMYATNATPCLEGSVGGISCGAIRKETKSEKRRNDGPT